MKAVAAVIAPAAASDRIAGLDLLRGVCALGVVAYHVLDWTKQAHLYTWGTYAVYIFFVVSGASMWVAYAQRFAAGLPITRFLWYRLARLAPLYLFALAAVVIEKLQGGASWHIAGQTSLNALFQFGLGNPGATELVLGGWSLGIEFVFYLLFPVCLALVAGRWWWGALSLAFVSQHVFIQMTLGHGASWETYTQPLAFVFYFLAGCAIGRALQAGKLRAHWLGLPVLVGCVAVIASASGPTFEAALIGPMGMALSLLAVCAVAAASVARVGRFLPEHLGAASYGVYLLHPPLYWLLHGRWGVQGPQLLAGVLAASVALALLLHHAYELPAQRRLKR